LNLASAVDLPHAIDFVDPYFFFSSRQHCEITFASPSVRTVLGYDPQRLAGVSYTRFLWSNDALNADVEECQQMDLRGGQSVHALRAVLDAAGNRRILMVHTTGIPEAVGGPIVRRHTIARDVTHCVQTHAQLSGKLQTLELASRRMSWQEREVADRIVAGKMNREIAEELQLSDRTIERRRAAIMKHFGAATTSEMIAKLTELQLLKTCVQLGCDPHWRKARNAHLVSPAVAA